MIRNLFLIGWVLAGVPGVAQTDVMIRQKHYNLDDRVALDGYDPVSYFSGTPREGSDEISISHRGITYHFFSKDNASKFKADPEKYEPAYGGWCAYAMGTSGEKVKVDPETYKIVDGKLYLFYNFWGNNTLRDWNADEPVLKGVADKNWRHILR